MTCYLAEISERPEEWYSGMAGVWLTLFGLTPAEPGSAVDLESIQIVDLYGGCSGLGRG
jgi:hypothetical protein